MKKIIFVALYFVTFNFYAQVGLGTNAPHVSSALDISSSSKGLLVPRMTNAQKNAISSPETSLVVWCTDCESTGLMQVFNGTSWTNMDGVITQAPSSNGTAVIGAYTDCSTATAGTLTAGVAVSGVTQTLTLNVTDLGTYSISAIVNGVTFSGSGTFTSTGVQTVVLTASGTPVSTGTSTFILNTSPNCTFTRTVN